VRLKLFSPILFALILLVSCQKQPTPADTTPTIEPSITGQAAPEIDQATAEAIRQHMAVFLRSDPYTQYSEGSQLLLYLVSSGEFSQATITLPGGEAYQADVLYVYALMRSQRVLIVPIAIGMTLSDGTYAYFSENYAFEIDGGVITTSAGREAALTDARERLPRGRIFRLLAYGLATREGLDWQSCSSVSLYPPEICPVGELIEQLYPNQTKTFVLGLADEFPRKWLLVGWVFQEFSQSELVLGLSINVPLPEPSQP
jgi:hypothetical protein